MIIIFYFYFVFFFRIDYETMVIADPDGPTTADSSVALGATDSINTGDCNTDTLTSTFHCKLYQKV